MVRSSLPFLTGPERWTDGSQLHLFRKSLYPGLLLAFASPSLPSLLRCIDRTWGRLSLCELTRRIAKMRLRRVNALTPFGSGLLL